METYTGTKGTAILTTEMMLPVRGLASKFGFEDGDAVSNFLCENSVFIDGDDKSALVALVRKYLLPTIPNVGVYEICTHHNPIRCEGEWIDFCEKCDDCVYVPLSEVVATVLGRKS